MRISKKTRELVRLKYGGLCAYTGKPLGDDWQVDHIKPLIRDFDGRPREEGRTGIENMIPALKIVNHYKGGLDIETFRNWYLGGLHDRLRKLPKNPKAPASIRKKRYLLEIAEAFDISKDKPFSGIFYFEKLELK